MPDFVYYDFDIDQLNVSVDDALDTLREPDRSENNPIVGEVKEVYDRLPEICDIRGGYAIYDRIDIFPDGRIGIDGTEIETHKRVCVYMKNSEKIAVFICTAGIGFTEQTKRYNGEGEFLKAFTVDSFGSIVVEKAMDKIQADLQAKMRSEGLEITNRYSPGYCNWKLVGQKQLFALLPENRCRISLTKSSLMLPIKSVSGIIGIGKTVKYREYTCETCNDLACVYREIRQRQAVQSS